MEAFRSPWRPSVPALLALWVSLVALHAWHYVTSILSLPDLAGGYESEWDFQLLMFGLVRLPFWILALGIVLFLNRARKGKSNV